MILERSLEKITKNDLSELYNGSKARLEEYFSQGAGRKWLDLYDIEKPIVAALCQGAAMHFRDGTTGVRDFDVWFFYPFNKKHLPYRTIWNWDYQNPKFGRHPDIKGYTGRKVDVLVRSIHNYSIADSVKTIHEYLQYEDTDSSRELSKKAVVILYPENQLGKVAWYYKKALKGLVK